MRLLTSLEKNENSVYVVVFSVISAVSKIVRVSAILQLAGKTASDQPREV